MLYPVLKPMNTPRINTLALVRPKKNIPAESLQVFCRLRPTEEQVSVKIISDTTLRLTVPPESCVSTRTATWNEYEYSFKRVFSQSHSEKEVFDCVALPLVENVIKGKDGLLFTYGVTGSGKTYTMTGTANTVGIMPRCLDLIFNSISEYQVDRFIFKPDKMNGFEVQSEEDAKKERNNFIKYSCWVNSKLKKNESNEKLTELRSKENKKIPVLDEDNAFAVFVTYTEVYNNDVCDLLENINESGVYTKFQKKIVRDDPANNVYVHGVTEIEVKTREEAYEVFRIGQKRKRMAYTSLNTESSRSHSIFTIRLVQAPWNVTGERVLQDKESLIISQLSLVDLAGIERTSRTKNNAERLHEAGKINNSLMMLRTCLKILRENQLTGGSKRIPYRDARLTRLFKNYFDGKGDIHMVVCVNPRTNDKDENMEVMKFAEISQQIQVKPTSARTEATIGLTPGRRRVNQAVKKLQMVIEQNRESESSGSEDFVSCFLDFSLESFSPWENFDPADADAIVSLMTFLEDRIAKKKTLMADLNSRAEKFREALSSWKDNYRELQISNSEAVRELDLKELQIKALEEQLRSKESKLCTVEKERDKEKDNVKQLERILQLQEQNFELRLVKQTPNNVNKNALRATTDKNTLRGKAKKARFDDHETATSTSTDIAMPLSTDHQRTVLPVKTATIAVVDERYPRTGHGDQWLDHWVEEITDTKSQYYGMFLVQGTRPAHFIGPH